jgi:hypothetical protein
MAKKAAKKPAKKAARTVAKTGHRNAGTRRSPEQIARAIADDGSPAAKFFTMVEGDIDLQDKIRINNQNILQIAADAGFRFTYAEMADHLRARWCITCGPKEHYCCF